MIKPITDDKRDKRLISSEPTNILIERRLVSVKELKNELNNSIRNNTSKKA
jgi:hypothetical protein